MLKIDKIIFALLFLFFTVNVFAQVIEEEEMVEEEEAPVYEDNTFDVSAEFTPPTVIPKKVRRKNHRGRYGFFGSGVTVIPFIYDELPKEFSDFMVAQKGKKYGAINKRNEIVVPFTYSQLFSIYGDRKTKKESGYYMAYLGDKKGVLNKKGEVVIPIQYSTLSKIADNIYTVGPKDGKYGFLTYSGKEIHPFTFENIPNFAFKNHYIIQMDGKQGVCNLDGKKVIPLQYDYISPTSSRNYLVTRNDSKSGLLDKIGKQILPAEYDQIKEKSDGTWIVTKNAKQGVLDSNFQQMVPLIYDDIKMRNDNYFLVRKNNDYGVVNLKGAVVLPCEYQKLLLTKGNVFVGRKKRGDGYYIIDEKGNPIIEQSFATASNISGVNFLTFQKEKDGKYALFNADSKKMITDFEYDSFYTKRKRGSRKGEREIKFKKDGMVGTISETGEKSNPDNVKNTPAYRSNNRSQIKKDKISKDIVGTWDGLLKIGEKEYLRELTFQSAASGIRKVYYKEKRKQCTLQHEFIVVMIGEGSGYNPFQLVLKLSSLPVSTCGKVPAELSRMQQEWITIERVTLGQPLLAKEVTRKKENTPSVDIDSRLRLLTITKELNNKLDVKPGSLRTTKFNVDPISKILSVNFLKEVSELGMVKLEGDEYVLAISAWEKTGNYHLSGTIQNVKYIDPDGKVKVGDLDLCFSSRGKQKYRLKEFKK